MAAQSRARFMCLSVLLRFSLQFDCIRQQKFAVERLEAA